MAFQPGDLIGERYELGRQLGAGGMARVYLGHDRLLDRRVAVKVLSEPYASDPSFVERFRREASAAAGLNHPNIVAVYDRGEADGSYYIVMEYLAGPDLKQVIRQRAPLAPLEAIDAALQILAALGAAHRRDLVHRDVKPQNVLVAEDGHLKVTDFGIARAGAESDMTEAGSVIGTAQYLSPEQARGGEVTAASDCYAVGIVLYEMLTGRVPFDGGPPVAVAMKQITEAPVPVREVEPAVPPALEAVTLRALAKRPSERYRTAEEMSQALREVRAEIDGTGATTRMMAAAPPPGDTGRTRVMAPPPPAETGRRWWPWVLAIVAVLIAAAVAGFLLLGGGAEKVTIPPVQGAEEAAATQTLEALGLTVDPVVVTNDTITAGRVVSTNPPEGTEVEADSTVTLRVSGGPGNETIPDVSEQEGTAATAELERLGFDVRPQEEASSEIEEGLAIRTDPPAGQEAERNTTVTLFISTGAEQVQVPNVRRLDRAQAERLITERGLRVSVDNEQTSAFAPGIVFNQTPNGGQMVDKDSVVTITVAVAASNLPVPDVVNQPADLARQTLEDAGFVVTSDSGFSNTVPVGFVIAQSVSGSAPPNSGSAPPNTRIVITVSEGPDLSGGGDSQPPPPSETTP